MWLSKNPSKSEPTSAYTKTALNTQKKQSQWVQRHAAASRRRTSVPLKALNALHYFPHHYLKL